MIVSYILCCGEDLKRVEATNICIIVSHNLQFEDYAMVTSLTSIAFKVPIGTLSIF